MMLEAMVHRSIWEILPIDDEVQENVKKVVTTNPQLIDFHKVKSSGDAF